LARLEFFTNRLPLTYVLFCWVLPLVLTVVFASSRIHYGPVEISFPAAEISEIKVEVLSGNQQRTLSIFPKPTSKTPWVIYDSLIQRITVKTYAKPFPAILIGPLHSSEKTNIELEQKGDMLSSKVLNYSTAPVGDVYSWGFYLQWVLLFSLGFGIALVLKNYLSLKNEIVFFAFLALAFAQLANLHWPGHLSYDALIDYKTALLGVLSASTLPLYSTLQMALINIFNSLAVGMIFNLLLAALFFTVVYSLSRKKWETFLLFLAGFAFFYISKINQHLSIFQNRDITFSWVFLLFLVTFSQGQFRWSIRTFFFVLAVMLRKETILLSPLLLLFEWRRNPRKKYLSLVRFTVPLIILVTYFSGDPRLKSVSDVDDYKATAYINPMMHIIAKRGKSILTPAEIKSVSDIVDFDQALLNHDPVDIKEFNLQIINREALKTNGGEQKFRKVALRLFYDYPEDWLQNRLMMGLGIIGLDTRTYWFNNEAFENPLYPELAAALPTTNYSNGPDAWRNVSAARELRWYRVLLASCLPAIGVMTVLLFFWNLFPLTSMATLMVLFRTGVIIALAPATYYKYVWSTTIWGAVVPALAAAEYYRRKKLRADR
jgi:hypothetical protein